MTQTLEEAADKLTLVKREVTSAISNSHGFAVSILFGLTWFDTITTSGKVRRATCVENTGTANSPA